MANRHTVQKKARGGHITSIHGGGSAHDGTAPRKDPSKLLYTGQGSNVSKEAKEMKRGGKAHGHKGKARLDKRARGGGIKAAAHKPHTPGVHASGKDETKSPFSAAHVKPMHSDGGNPHPHHLKHKGPHVAKPKDSHSK